MRTFTPRDSAPTSRGQKEPERAKAPPDPAALRPLHAKFYRALAAEVQAIRDREEEQAVPIGPPDPIEDARGPRYRAQTESPRHPFSAGDRVLVRIGDQSIEGKITEVEQSHLTFCLPAYLSPSPSAGQVLPDTAWLTAALRDRISETIRALQVGRRPSPPFHFDLALRVLGLREANPGTAPVPHEVVAGDSDLNKEQKRAVGRSLGSDVLYLWGPPGTGKSSTLARIVEGHWRRGASVLALASSNQAVDVLTGKLVDRLADDPDFERGDLLRIGPGVTDHLDKRARELVVPAEMASPKKAAGIGQPLGHNRPAIGQDRLEGIATENRAGPFPSRPAEPRDDRPPRIITTTLHQCVLAQDPLPSYNVVVIDEASMLSVPAVYLAAGRARSHVVVAGDFLQLPPVAAVDEGEAKQILTTDVFQAIGMSDAIRRDETPPGLVGLRKQYRMQEGICRLAREFAYGGHLETAPAVRNRLGPDTALGRDALYCVDSGSLDPRVTRPNGSSRVNEAHAWLDRALVDYLLLGPDGMPDPTAEPVSILTPFTGQVRLLEEKLRPRYSAEQVPINTIHGSQGDEHRIVILDLVDARGLGVSRFLKADRITAPGARLLNVGLTRARDQLIVVGDFETLAYQGGQGIRRLVQALSMQATPVRPQRILPTRLPVGA